MALVVPLSVEEDKVGSATAVSPMPAVVLVVPHEGVAAAAVVLSACLAASLGLLARLLLPALHLLLFLAATGTMAWCRDGAEHKQPRVSGARAQVLWQERGSRSSMTSSPSGSRTSSQQQGGVAFAVLLVAASVVVVAAVEEVGCSALTTLGC